MRPWIEYLLNNQGMLQDFINYLKEVDVSLKANLSKAVMENRIEDARGLAYELQAYENMRKRFESERRERESQSTYNEQFKGRQ